MSNTHAYLLVHFNVSRRATKMKLNHVQTYTKLRQKCISMIECHQQIDDIWYIDPNPPKTEVSIKNDEQYQQFIAEESSPYHLNIDLNNSETPTNSSIDTDDNNSPPTPPPPPPPQLLPIVQHSQQSVLPSFKVKFPKLYQSPYQNDGYCKQHSNNSICNGIHVNSFKIIYKLPIKSKKRDSLESFLLLECFEIILKNFHTILDRSTMVENFKSSRL